MTLRYALQNDFGIVVHPDVRKALRERQAVVALESTIISHGMPYVFLRPTIKVDISPSRWPPCLEADGESFRWYFIFSRYPQNLRTALEVEDIVRQGVHARWDVSCAIMQGSPAGIRYPDDVQWALSRHLLPAQQLTMIAVAVQAEPCQQQSRCLAACRTWA